jgi:phosphatidylglycerol:prolipoprotein diacylglycerol transferase
MYPPFSPAFHLGPLRIHWYGIIMVAAIFIAALLASRYVERRGQDGNIIWSMLLWVVIPAIIGARLYYVFVQAPRGPDGLGNYLAHPLQILAIWQGGIHIYGALIGGGIALLMYLAVKRLPPLLYLDAVGLALLPGQAIGRLGNFMNQELYGPPTTLPWGLRIDPAYRLAPYNNLALYPESVRFQPLFLYEMIWDLLGFSLICWMARRFEKRLRAGDIVLMYLIWYPTGRFFLEFFRTDSWFFPGTSFDLVHILSALVVVCSSILLIARHRNWLGRPVIAAATPGGAVALLADEETVAGGGIDMSEEYLFLRHRHQASGDVQEEVGAEEREDEIEDDESLEEESEGIEDIEDWDGASPEEGMMFEESEEYLEEISRKTEAVEALKREKRNRDEDEEDEEDEDEEEEREEEEESGEEEGGAAEPDEESLEEAEGRENLADEEAIEDQEESRDSEGNEEAGGVEEGEDTNGEEAECADESDAAEDEECDEDTDDGNADASSDE